MKNYQVSARKYRPTRFEEVVGQKHVTETLKNAIKSEQLAQAFLFCGPRGVGKTTCARLLAKAINAPEPIKSLEDGSYANLDLDISLNIFELDAASNNSVEDIRNLIEQVRFAPQSGRYKVYIIDEVHMLSQQAFNAFLKTLEEPPPYAIFILATTEKHKILPTILSRCQIFNFKRINVKDIVEHLKDICKQKEIEAEDTALHLMAEKADGALRDALSIFDRIASFSTGKIEYTAVLEALNVLDYEYYFKISDALIKSDSSAALVLLDDIIQQGFDGGEFLEGLARHFRHLLFAKEKQTADLLELSEKIQKRYHTQAQTISSAYLLSGLNIVNDFALNYRMVQNKRLQVELALLKLSFIQAAIEYRNVPLDTASSKKKIESTGSSDTKSLNELVAKTALTTPISTEVSGVKATEQQTTPKNTQKNTKEGSEIVLPKLEESSENKTEVEKKGKEVNEIKETTDKPKPSKPVTKVKKVNLAVKKDKDGAKSSGSLDLTSLAAIDEKIEAETEEIAQKIKVIDSDLNTEKIVEVWNTFATGLVSEQSQAIFAKYQPILNENSILVTVSNKLEQTRLGTEARELIETLTKKHNLQDLDLKVSVDDSLAPKEKKAFTPKEKFEAMIEKNANLADFQRRLFLEVKH